MHSSLLFAATAVEPQLKGSLQVSFATQWADIREAQRLRYEVFAWELGAHLHSPIPGLDQDQFDDYCQHLLVRDSLTQKIVGYTRVLTDQSAYRAGGFYSQTEFDITRILALPGRFMEVGRTCVHPDYRNGTTIAALWSGLAAFIDKQGCDYLIGCASIPLGVNYSEAQAVFADLSQRFLVEEHLRVHPLQPLPRQDVIATRQRTLPPLLKAYLRLGAKICGEPYLDLDFKVADLFILLPTQHLDKRYARHFMGRTQ